MALVAYGSSGESDLSDAEDEVVNAPRATKGSQISKAAAETKTSKDDDQISDEEGEWNFQSSADNIEDLNIPGLSTSKSIFDSLPQAVIKPASPEPDASKFIDENEDLSTIPAAKTYGGIINDVNGPLIAKKINSKGRARIFAPTLNVNSDSDDEGSSSVKPYRPRPRVEGQTKTNLLSFLPPPKNSSGMTEKNVLGAGSTTSTISSLPTKNLVPRSISRPPVPTPSTAAKRSSAAAAAAAAAAKRAKAESDSDDDENFSFFTLDKEEITPEEEEAAAFKARLATVKSTPELETSGHSSAAYRYPLHNEPEAFGPATAPYPPPAPTASTSSAGPDDLLADEDALLRLVGRKGLRKKGEEINIIEVKNDDIKPDPREWMTKALTEESERGEPGPKCLIKGEKKRKHQITYLAAMAKEREHVLKQEWSLNAQSRRATQSKYGF